MGRHFPAGSLRLTDAINVLTSSEGASAYPSIAVGPKSFIVSTAPTTLIFSKAGELISQMSTRDMFDAVMPANSGHADMRILFDERSGRFFYVGAALTRCEAPACTATWMIAVSRNSEPMTLGANDWRLYGFDGSLEDGRPSGQKGDFNVVSLTDDKLILTGISLPPEHRPAYAKIWVFDSRPFLAGDPVGGPIQSYARLRDPVFGRQFEKTHPATTFGSTKTAFLVGWIPGTCSVGVIGISGPPGNAELRVHTARAPGECVGPTHAPQLGGGAPLDTMPQIETPPVYRDGHLWFVQSILASAPSGRVGAVRLVELDVSRWPEVPTYVRDDTYLEDDVWYFNPALTVDATHNVAVVANRSSPREYGSIWLTGRRFDDPPGAFRAPVALKQGEANWNWVVTSHSPPIRERNLFSTWSGAAIDPIDGTAWFTGQSARTACEWDVWVGRTDFTVVASAAGSLAPPPPPSVRPLPCTVGQREEPSGPFAVRYLDQLAVGAVPERPTDIPVAFEVSGADLGRLTPEQAGRIVVSPRANGWTTTARHRFVLLLPPDAEGRQTLTLRLPDGREASVQFEVFPPE